jgi:hypothetical protein
MEVQTHALPQNDSSSDVPVAPPSLAEGGVSHGPLHVFPVLAASLDFLRKIEMALETPVFERLVGEVANVILLHYPWRNASAGAAGGVCVYQLIPNCNQCAKWENSRASVCMSIATAAAGGYAGALKKPHTRCASVLVIVFCCRASTLHLVSRKQASTSGAICISCLRFARWSLLA